MRERAIRLSLSLPHELAQYARERAEKDNTTISSVVGQAIRGYRSTARREQTRRMLALNEGLDRGTTRDTAGI